MIEELHALTANGMMGRILWDRSRDRLSFVYEPEWRTSPASYPLSLSMPLTAAEHGHKVVDAFLWGLLPDNDGILKRWGERFHVSPRHAFQLLMHVGEECAGAVQLVRPERAEKWILGKDTGTIAWLEDAEITGRMRLLLRDHSVARTSSDVGQFSLAGAQPKTGFIYDPKQGRWGVPSGVIPTTHIFKPATGAYDGYAENEHFCIALAREFGMPVAPSAIRYFDEVPVIVVERYDRVRKGKEVIRVHQEDMCQSLARMPHLKYQSQGGPSPREIIDLIREYSTNRQEDERRFVDALIFNWLIGGTDAHAKNYSFLIAPSQVRLAPLYDLSSALPYPQQVAPRKAKLAMKIGGKYNLLSVGAFEWEKCAAELRMDVGALRARVSYFIEAVPHTSYKVANKIHAQGIKHDVISRICDALAERARLCAGLMKENR